MHLARGGCVLRHWEDAGALSVRREENGHRVFDDDAMDRARTVLRLRRVGLSLPGITAAMSPEKSAAQAAVRRTIATWSGEIDRRRQRGPRGVRPRGVTPTAAPEGGGPEHLVGSCAVRGSEERGGGAGGDRQA
ncbi:MerR family transcriptional regulator [Streptomyces sp. RFCAC02]|uniref:MerR family transcriptional regulator n=1 Tax=Streptomyces sp. RFCAC02 TaxID=2499143 RepID=UPI0010204CB7|nr:MerR family transcriptional regulator [Streptomyces sp. RFCAC02]